MTDGKQLDRFGLEGAPEIRDAPRKRLGSALPFLALMLALRLFAAALFLPSGPGRHVATGEVPPELGAAGFTVFALQVPVLLLGLWQALRGRADIQRRRWLVLMAFSFSVFLDPFSRVVSDLALERTIDGGAVVFSLMMLVLLAWMLFKGPSLMTNAA